MEVTVREVEEALAAQKADPDSPGPLVRLLRLAAAMGTPILGARAARAFMTRHRLPPAVAEALMTQVAILPVRVVEHGEPLTQEGEPGDSVFVILRGQVSVWRQGVGPVDTLQAGEIFGEIAALEGTMRTATALAQGEVRVAEIDTSSRAKLQQVCPALIEAMVGVARQRTFEQICQPGSAFFGLNVYERDAFVQRLRILSVPEGTRIIREGQPAAGFCSMVSGRVGVYRTDIHGRILRIAQLGPGDFFGEISLMYEIPTTAAVTAESPVVFTALRPDDFATLLRQHPHAAEVLMAAAKERLGQQEIVPRLESVVTVPGVVESA